MVSILDVHEPLDKPEVAEPPVEEAAQEFEFVLGWRQIASLSFVAIVVLMVCVAIAYLAGKSMSAKVVAAAPSAAVTAREPEPQPILLNQEPAPEPPIFAEPKNGSVYIQIGAVEKGVAVVLAHGLRNLGFEAFVGPGPTPTVFRVLIGPLANPADYVKAKQKVDDLGLATFARKFPN